MEPKDTRTEIRRGDELVILPETPLELVRMSTLFPRLVEALEWEHTNRNSGSDCPRDCGVCNLLKEARGDK